MSFGDSDFRTQQKLANYVPGPALPPWATYEPRTLPCGCLEEDCDGFECATEHLRA